MPGHKSSPNFRSRTLDVPALHWTSLKSARVVVCQTLYSQPYFNPFLQLLLELQGTVGDAYRVAGQQHVHDDYLLHLPRKCEQFPAAKMADQNLLVRLPDKGGMHSAKPVTASIGEVDLVESLLYGRNFGVGQ